ncbi:Ubiquinone/menaquinone biosynthesis C-methylase UbiE [Ruegeria halocynthiae]|uniref:Ubiquinone/menaquinone biosynthesis C-methylase UbiE n=1 Tax=Ruegeria halocynthiae TaxID=985054 RepID=A0A1H2T663_9RHOB|nr:class I SAM-dependent methyltransferase [Ruegeria halocynthiae]SDW39436.1 Ubiquinone/menaquinone biosynthesis C-methylase UbiE [Ruegeria halocynthiae]
MLSINGDQEEFWGKSEMGGRWLTFEDQLDHLFSPVLDLLLDRAALTRGMRVVDIGCGTGASALTVAQQIGPEGHVLGVDISEQFLERARRRADQANLNNVKFRYADAQVAALSTGDCDALISRFGVMFFSDPVAAFANMARALKPGGQITFAAWGALSENPWFKTPHLAAVKQLGQPPKVDRNAPGPLAFHDRDRVSDLMSRAGLADIKVKAIPLTLAAPSSAKEAATLCTRVGPAARVIAHFEGEQGDVDAIINAVADEFEAYRTPEGVRVPAVINLLQARAS